MHSLLSRHLRTKWHLESQTNCTTCKTANYMMGSQCISSSQLNMIPNGTSCSTCLANCNICNQANFLCSVNSGGFYLYNNLCFDSCPSSLVVSLPYLCDAGSLLLTVQQGSQNDDFSLHNYRSHSGDHRSHSQMLPQGDASSDCPLQYY
jgi:hypothetical protein